MYTVAISRKRLIWKELKQQRALIGTSVLITIVLYLLTLFRKDVHSSAHMLTMDVLLVGLPGLFAVGIGALLIGQEKDQKTILWLQSLPIAARELVRSKLIASLIGLASMWIVSLILVTIFSGGEYWHIGSRLAADGSLQKNAIHAVHTLFLLLAGLAISWRINSAFLALILLVPIALVPYLMATLLSVLFYQSPEDVIGSGQLLACQIVCCVGAGYWGWRAAVSALRPAAASRAVSLKSVTASNLGLPYSKFSALLWQFTKQNKLPLMGIMSLFLVAMLFTLMLVRSPSSANHLLSWNALEVMNVGFLGISWLGVLAFQSDRLNRRIRFLADRGLSPAITWTSRQGISVAGVSIALILFLFVLMQATNSLQQRSNQSFFSPEIFSQLVVPIIFAVLVIYSVSQWIGQLFTSAIVAAVVAPLTSFGVVLYLLSSYQSVGTALWLLCIVATIPLVATRLLTRRWMDDRWDQFYWATHAATIILLITLPLLPLAYAWVTSPKMNPMTQAALMAHLTKNPAGNFATTDLTLQLPPLRESIQQDVGLSGAVGLQGIVESGYGNEVTDASEVTDDSDGTNGSEAPASARQSLDAAEAMKSDASVLDQRPPSLEDLTIEQRSDHLRQALSDQLSGSSGPVRANFAVIQWLRSELMIQRMTSGDSAVSERYQQLIRLAANIALRMRLSHDLAVHESADRLEIALVAELLQAKQTGLMDAATWQHLCQQLGDKSKRDTARRTAIAYTWKLHSSNSTSDFAELGLDQRGLTNLIDYMTRRSRAARVAELLWHLSEADQGSADSVRAQLAEALNVSPALYGLGNHGRLLRADDPHAYLFESTNTKRGMSIGTQWQAGWEHQAELIAQENSP